ncbi:hypothetical protein MASR1M31_07860 [Porphyromonadaceae bacterium]
MKKKNQTRRHYDNFFVAGFVYWEAPLVFESMKVGETVELEREDDNKFDPYAVAIYYHGCKIGFVPRTNNHDLSKFLEMFHGDIFEARINSIDPTAHPDSRVGITVYIKYADGKTEKK